MEPFRTSDALDRPLSDLRISVTDRCNFRCRYCMPREHFEGRDFLRREEILSFEEIYRFAKAAVELGVNKLRLTGGEPLLRRQLPRLVEQLARLNVDLALTTNGILLPRHARALRDAGLSRVTVSLDALDEEVFQKTCDAPGSSAEQVLAGIAAAQEAGFESIKINCVVRRGHNEDQLLPLMKQFWGTSHALRFIEYMDVGAANGWDSGEVVPAAEIIAQAARLGEVVALPARSRSEVARRYRVGDQLEIGVISSISAPFCGDCSRARLSADGHLYTCLFASAGRDFKGLLRDPQVSGTLLRESLAGVWSGRSDRYSELRSEQARAAAAAGDTSDASTSARRHLPLAQRVEMSFIGG